jgi:hypothetical protein
VFSVHHASSLLHNFLISGKAKGGKGQVRGNDILQLDRVRVLSTRLIADLLMSWPAVASEAQVCVCV